MTNFSNRPSKIPSSKNSVSFIEKFSKLRNSGAIEKKAEVKKQMVATSLHIRIIIKRVKNLPIESWQSYADARTRSSCVQLVTA